MRLHRSLKTARRHQHSQPHAGKRSVKRLCLCIVLAVFAASTALALAPASAHAIGMTKPEKQMLALINHARAKHGLHTLKMVGVLERASRSHSHEMVTRGYFAHCSSRRRVVREPTDPLRLLAVRLHRLGGRRGHRLRL